MQIKGAAQDLALLSKKKGEELLEAVKLQEVQEARYADLLQQKEGMMAKGNEPKVGGVSLSAGGQVARSCCPQREGTAGLSVSARTCLATSIPRLERRVCVYPCIPALIGSWYFVS